MRSSLINIDNIVRAGIQDKISLLKARQKLKRFTLYFKLTDEKIF